MPLNLQPKFFSDGSYLACSRHLLKYLNVAIWPIQGIQNLFGYKSEPVATSRTEPLAVFNSDSAAVLMGILTQGLPTSAIAVNTVTLSSVPRIAG